MKQPDSQETTLNLDHIDHKRHERYSPNLHKFLTREKTLAKRGRVFRDMEGTLWLGYWFDGDFTGVRLMQVLCLGTKASLGCYVSHLELEEVLGFWQDYMLHGRCVLDRKHEMYFLNATNRFTTTKTASGKHICNWCGSEVDIAK